MEVILKKIKNTETTQMIFKPSREKRHPKKTNQSDIRLISNTRFRETRDKWLHHTEEKWF